MTDRTPTGDLRERLAEALTREHYRRARERIEASLEEHCAAFADAVLSVVEAETAALRQRAEQAEAALQRVRNLAASLHDGVLVRCFLSALDQPEEAPTGQERAAPVDWEAIALQRERELKEAGEARHRAEAALRDLTDPRPCDPHPGNGYCQTHGEKAPCPHAAAKAILDRTEETP